MKEFVFGEYTICADSSKTKKLYAKRGQHFLKCACPGCQNFFKGIKPYQNELEAYLSNLGIEWSKPDEIKVLHAENNRAAYRITYTFFGKRKNPPKRWITQKNEIGSINIRNPRSIFQIDECVSMSFLKSEKGKAVAEVTASLPWLMETLNCIYDEGVVNEGKKIPSTPQRLCNAIKAVREMVK